MDNTTPKEQAPSIGLWPDRISIPQSSLDVEIREKINPLPWRGQFNPQLVDVLLNHYGNSSQTVLDPFCGSGTVLLEALRHSKDCLGSDINPAAYIMSSVYKFSEIPIDRRLDVINRNFPDRDFHYISIIEDNEKLAADRSAKSLKSLHSLILSLPYSSNTIDIYSCDARSLPIKDNFIDLIITSPPYINVFNYHQNQRGSIESLGYQVLDIARSEIGSNRANRGNRLITVVQYCIDIALTIKEMLRVLKENSKIILIVGRESKVLGYQFFNSKIILDIMQDLFAQSLHNLHERKFLNRFGEVIFEDILIFTSSKNNISDDLIIKRARAIAKKHLINTHSSNLQNESKSLVLEAIERSSEVSGTPLLDQAYPRGEEMTTPHYAKLAALLRNSRLPPMDRPRVELALEKYHKWVEDMNAISSIGNQKIQELSSLLNKYKNYIDYDLIFMSEHDFLYRQKGQLKIDNSILEEFLSRLVDPSIIPELSKFNNLTTGPQKSYSGMSFTSVPDNLSSGGAERRKRVTQEAKVGFGLWAIPSQRSRQILPAILVHACCAATMSLEQNRFARVHPDAHS